jgi:hypothetical protein
MVEKLLDDWLWRQRMERAKSQMRAASKEEWADYLAEAAEWDVTSGDGLEDYPWVE